MPDPLNLARCRELANELVADARSGHLGILYSHGEGAIANTATALRAACDEVEKLREAEEDGRLVAGIQKDYATWAKNGHNRKYYPMWLGDALDIIGRMSARAAAGYPVLIAPKGE